MTPKDGAESRSITAASSSGRSPIGFWHQTGTAFQVDIVAKHKPDGTTWLFEVKGTQRLSVEHVDRFHGATSRSLSHPEPIERVLVGPGIVTDAAIGAAIKHHILIWDLPELARRTTEDLINRFRLDVPSRRPQAPSVITLEKKAEDLRGRFASIKPGADQWAEFQRLVSDTFEFLFVPPLGPPDYESVDAERRNRRDFVMENAAERGTWAALRTRYNADYVAVDSKNSVSINKAEVVLTAHYLKPYGLGMLAFVAFRGDAKVSARHAVREQWVGNGKLIVLVNDKDMLAMIKLRAEGAAAEDHIRRAIADFRKSL